MTSNRSILPNQDEVDRISSFDGDMLTLKDCDHFVLLMKLIPGFNLRLNIIFFKHTYDESIKNINDILESAFDLVIFFKENEKFLYFMDKLKEYRSYITIKNDK